MADSVFDRARGKGNAALGAGNWIDDQKDDMVHDQLVFGITDVRFDERGSQFGERWIVSVVPWYEGDENPNGDLSFKSTSYRDEYFQELADELDKLDRKGDEVILGPVVLIKARTANKKNRYFDIVEWDEKKNEPILPKGVEKAPDKDEGRGDTRRGRPARAGGRRQAAADEDERPSRGRGRSRDEDEEESEDEEEEKPATRRGRGASASASRATSARRSAPARSDDEEEEEDEEERDERPSRRTATRGRSSRDKEEHTSRRGRG